MGTSERKEVRNWCLLGWIQYIKLAQTENHDPYYDQALHYLDIWKDYRTARAKTGFQPY